MYHFVGSSPLFLADRLLRAAPASSDFKRTHRHGTSVRMSTFELFITPEVLVSSPEHGYQILGKEPAYAVRSLFGTYL